MNTFRQGADASAGSQRPGLAASIASKTLGRPSLGPSTNGPPLKVAAAAKVPGWRSARNVAPNPPADSPPIVLDPRSGMLR